MINGATQIALTCVDRIFPNCERVQDYSELTQEVKNFVAEIEGETGVPVTIISTGPDLVDTIDLGKNFFKNSIKFFSIIFYILIFFE